MKKIVKTIFLVLITLFLSICTYSKVYADNIEPNSYISEETGKILIPFTKNWQDVSDEELPDSVTIKLYKYTSDTFDERTAILIKG